MCGEMRQLIILAYRFRLHSISANRSVDAPQNLDSIAAMQGNGCTNMATRICGTLNGARNTLTPEKPNERSIYPQTLPLTL